MYTAFDRFEGDFDSWVRHVFDHPAPKRDDLWTDPPWHFDIYADTRVPDDLTCARYLTRLFRDPVRPLASYDDAQAAQGLRFLMGEGEHHGWSLMHGSAPLEERVEAIAAISELFRRLFAVRCTPALGHLDETPGGPLNDVCYMWWDTFPTWGCPGDPSQSEIDSTILKILRESLHSGHDAILESSLHGLGHWQHNYPDAVRITIDEFLDRRRRQKVLRHELVRYAKSAREGYVQ